MPKPKKKYVPGRALQAAQDKKASLLPVDPSSVTKLCLIMEITLAEFLAGKATILDWHQLAMAANMAQAVDEVAYKSEYAGIPSVCMTSLQVCGRRFKQTKKFEFLGLELETVKELISLHTQQLNQINTLLFNRSYDLMASKFSNHEFTHKVVE